MIQTKQENLYTLQQLQESLLVLTSLLQKCKKAYEKETLSASQKTLLTNRIKAIEIAIALIKNALEK